MFRLDEPKAAPRFRQSPFFGVAVASIVWIVVALALPNSRAVDLLTAAAIFGLYVVSWAAFCGPALEVSFGQTFFIGTVAYLTALLHVRMGLSPVASLLLAPVAGALLGLAVAALSFRHRGLYFSMATMALQLTLYRCLFLYSPLFGGEEGVYGIRTIAATRTGAFALTGSVAIAGYLLAQIYVRSRHCLLLAAVGQNERLAEAIGVRVGAARAVGLALSGSLAALGGALYVFTIGQANVELAGDRLSARIVLLGTLGGAQTPTGPFLTGIAAYVFDQLLSNSIQYTGLAMSLLLLAMVILVPRGLVTTRPAWTPPRAASRPDKLLAKDDGPFALQDVNLAFGGVQALCDVSFSLRPGTVTGIIGPNGAGKTTLLRVLAGELEPDSGTLTWDSQPVRGGVSSRARRGLRKTFQHVEAFNGMTVREHLAVAMTVHGTSSSEPGVEDFLLEAGTLPQIDERLDALPAATARIVDLSMAVASRPRLVLLDEPFAGVSARQSEAVSNAVRRLRERGASIVVVEHRLKELFALVDRVLVMNRGEIVADERPNRVFQNPAVLAAYGTQHAAMDL